MDDDTHTRITLRLPKALHQRLQAGADATSKSMNAEIVARLEESYRSDQQPAALLALTYTLANVEMDLQAARIDTLELVRHLKFTLECLRNEDYKRDSKIRRIIDEIQANTDKFDTSVDAITAFGREQRTKIAQLEDAVRAAHALNGTTPNFDSAPAAPARRMRLKRTSKP